MTRGICIISLLLSKVRYDAIVVTIAFTPYGSLVYLFADLKRVH